jgi:cytosine/adenosine deaminase-related metal-dependent hydrolase
MRLQRCIKSDEISADVGRRLMEAEAKSAVGTDGAASGGGQDILENIKCAALLARCGTADPAKWLTPGQAMSLAVEGGRDIFVAARGIAPNSIADLAVSPSLRTRLTRFSIRCDNCSGARSGTRHVLVAGEPLVVDGTIVAFDISALQAELRQVREKFVPSNQGR